MNLCVCVNTNFWRRRRWVVRHPPSIASQFSQMLSTLSRVPQETIESYFKLLVSALGHSCKLGQLDHWQNCYLAQSRGSKCDKSYSFSLTTMRIIKVTTVSERGGRRMNESNSSSTGRHSDWYHSKCDKFFLLLLGFHFTQVINANHFRASISIKIDDSILSIDG